ncbi:MAG TPA: 60S ribosomal export protein NMD3 [Methanocorpusculum sp.]|nr:60S ribosomal export protein NMD3 [Methanocorpusculum sp.]
MAITQGFCPRCGAPSQNGELCGKCKVHETIWVEIAPRVQCTICPTCESVKTSGVWSDSVYDRDELACQLVNNAIKFHPDVTDTQVGIDIKEVSSNRSMATVLVMGKLYGIALEETKKVKIVWAREQCDRCSRIAGSYYEGVIQVRAEGRKPTQFELRRAAEIAYQLEDQLQKAGDRLSFVSSIDETKDGIDIIFSSQAIGNAIAHDIKGAMGGTATTHPKLVGEKAGIPIYRITHLLRLPHFSRGDIIVHGKGHFQILRQIKDTLFVKDLESGIQRSFREDVTDPLLGNIRNPQKATVIYRDAGVLGLMDLNTGSTFEAVDRPWIGAKEGMTVLFVRDNETIVTAGCDENTDYAEIESVVDSE